MKNVNEEKLEKLINESISKSEVLRKLGYSLNGRNNKFLKDFIEKRDINIDHFQPFKREKKYSIVEKTCPVCGGIFKTKKGHKSEKTTCSHSCSNTYFRSGDSNGNWRDSAYRSTCFSTHQKRCVICDEDKIVEVHHYNGDHEDNRIENLIPLCPTHHRYWHSRYRKLIKEKVDNYVKRFIKTLNRGVD